MKLCLYAFLALMLFCSSGCSSLRRGENIDPHAYVMPAAARLDAVDADFKIAFVGLRSGGNSQVVMNSNHLIVDFLVEGPSEGAYITAACMADAISTHPELYVNLFTLRGNERERVGLSPFAKGRVNSGQVISEDDARTTVLYSASIQTDSPLSTREYQVVLLKTPDVPEKIAKKPYRVAAADQEWRSHVALAYIGCGSQ